jgi:hypothetical protein
MPSPDHLKPQSHGGDDYPTNIAAAHVTCNKGRRDRSIEQYRACVLKGSTVAQKRFPERFKHLSVSDSLNESLSDSLNDSHANHYGNGKGMEHGSGNGNIPPSGGDDYCPIFEEFWKSFPSGRKTGKEAAAKAFRLALKKTTAETIIRAAKEYADSPVGNGEYVKGPTPWLNQGCWNDDRAAWQRSDQKHQPQRCIDGIDL